ncbi:hypothetical protein GCM10027440_06660 [Nocardiopsis coralliicola]
MGPTVIATALPYADSATTQLLASHIREGYPAYSAARIDSAVTAYQVILTAVGAAGAAAWAIAIGAAAAGRRWAAPPGDGPARGRRPRRPHPPPHPRHQRARPAWRRHSEPHRWLRPPPDSPRSCSSGSHARPV